MILIVIAGFLVYKATCSLPNYSSSQGNTAPDQPNNPPQSPPKPDQKESPTAERNKRIRQFLAAGNEFLLKTNPNLVPIPDDFIGELLEKDYTQAGDITLLGINDSSF